MLGICSRNNALASAKCPDFPSALTKFWAASTVRGRRDQFYGGALPCPARRNASGIKAKSTADYASTLFSMPLDSCDVAIVLEDDVLQPLRPAIHRWVSALGHRL